MRHLLLVPLALLAACQEPAVDPDSPDNLVTINPEDRSGTPADRPAYVPPAGPVEERSPVAQGPDDAGTAQDAAVLLRRYFALVEAGRWDHAGELWWDGDRAAAFAAQLRKFGEFDTNIAAPQRPEGAAGSVYVSISLQLLRNSRNLSDGTAVLRRVNDVPGSTAEQRQWRIDRISLQPPPVPLSAG